MKYATTEMKDSGLFSRALVQVQDAAIDKVRNTHVPETIWKETPDGWVEYAIVSLTPPPRPYIKIEVL